MSEIVVGACYRDVRDGEIVRVTDASDPLAPSASARDPQDALTALMSEAS